MQNNSFKKFIPHLIALGVFLLITVFYTSPVFFQGKELSQHDIKMWQGMSKEILDWDAKTGHRPLWTNSMFSGMPAYQISLLTPGNLIQHVNNIIWLGLPTTANVIFMLFVGFYLLLVTMRFDWRVAMAGSIAFAFCSYNFIIIVAGHNSKVHAIALMPFVLAGVVMTLRGNLWKGGILAAVALAMEIYANHLQITYYLMIGILILMINEFVYAIKDKKILGFIKSATVLLFALVLAVLSNVTNLWALFNKLSVEIIIRLILQCFPSHLYKVAIPPT